jgi:[ribosomal protein S18]-alanine N-acetyltransferase
MIDRTPTLVFEHADLARDLDAILEIDALTFTNPWPRTSYEREARASDVARLFVARMQEGLLVAYCSAWFIFDEAHINNLAVRPEWRRRGVASALMRYVLAEAERAGATRATLEVRRSNEAGRKLYKGLGFEVTGVRPGYYREPLEDALVLWREPFVPATP